MVASETEATSYTRNLFVSINSIEKLMKIVRGLLTSVNK